MNSFCRDRRMGQVLADSNLLTWFDLLYIYIARDVQTSICEYVRNTHTHMPSNITLPHDWTIMKHPIPKLPQAHPSWGATVFFLVHAACELDVSGCYACPDVDITQCDPQLLDAAKRCSINQSQWAVICRALRAWHYVHQRHRQSAGFDMVPPICQGAQHVARSMFPKNSSRNTRG